VKNAVKQLLTGGKERRMVQARSVLCYWGTRELTPDRLTAGEEQLSIMISEKEKKVLDLISKHSDEITEFLRKLIQNRIQLKF
jgi:hypothetical protein